MLRQNCEINNSGSGSITMQDDFPLLSNYEIYSSGSGAFYGCQLRVENVVVQSFGSSAVAVYAATALNVTLTGSGNVEYYGNPELTVSNSGSGQVIQGSDSDCILATTSVNNELTKTNFTIYPNPSISFISIEGIDEGNNATIVSASGKVINHFLITSKLMVLDVSKFPSGVYFLQIGNQSKLFVKQ